MEPIKTYFLLTKKYLTSIYYNLTKNIRTVINYIKIIFYCLLLYYFHINKNYITCTFKKNMFLIFIIKMEFFI